MKWNKFLSRKTREGKESNSKPEEKLSTKQKIYWTFRGILALIFHWLISTGVYFLIEVISRHSILEAWEYMMDRPLVFAYNTGLIFSTSLIVFLFRRRNFFRLVVWILWFVLGCINSRILKCKVRIISFR